MATDTIEPEGDRGSRRRWGGNLPPVVWVLASWKFLHRILHRLDATWLVRGYRAADAGDLATVIAFNGLLALVPTTLLLVSVAGLLLRQDRVLATASEASFWALPQHDTRDALDVLLAARRQSTWLGLVSLLGFVWIGGSFVGALARGMNGVYGVPNRPFVFQRLRAFAVVVVFAVLFVGAVLAATVPTLFVGHRLSAYFRTWPLAAWTGRIASYGLALLVAALLFLMLYRAVPNAGQRLGDVWPGALVAALLFVGLSQAFPLYLRLAGGVTRYGAVFGLLWLLVTWFYLLAHALLFGTYVNVTYCRYRGRWPPRP
jgi:membrane protein